MTPNLGDIAHPPAGMCRKNSILFLVSSRTHCMAKSVTHKLLPPCLIIPAHGRQRFQSIVDSDSV